ncbi:nucleotidyl transferase AbiEii/AbiGii toxin family protein [Arcobacter sp.]|uniref:nucleotidyl transferase AbiEii/AbiGii toxin family protein n=1 Tax=unclassified Arcobacter TaxID=2593671 RepID=UPI003B00C8E3|eukprot:TRINITY_DN4399_c0_g1_i3.p1 TRINITY_DN4399_c0_g1~~TRINITY_DN4399_c0_g1_i3.p1  ORF type:complete len:224 (+),score=-38.00 TRINITY_DN4399_c0_g1_i3:538-1209(+)
MTSNVIKVLDKIKDSSIFQDELYFIGGTALSYYLNHRVSEDIDIVSPKILDYKKVVTTMNSLGAKKIEDENTTALRLAGLFPDEYILKFILDEVKIEFFYANRPIQKEILTNNTCANYENSTLKILDLKSIAKLKIVALFQRDKARDLFDFYSLLENNVLTLSEVLSISKSIKNIDSKDKIIDFITSKKESKDDESVYLNEHDKIDLIFDEIKTNTILALKKI